MRHGARLLVHPQIIDSAGKCITLNASPGPSSQSSFMGASTDLGRYVLGTSDAVAVQRARPKEPSYV